MRPFPTLLALTVAAWTGCVLADETAAPKHNAVPDLRINGGQTVAIPGTDMTLALIDVQDQRCPAGLQCYWEGMMRVELSLVRPDAAPEPAVLCNLCDDGDRVLELDGIAMVLIGLDPTTEALAALGRDPLLTDYTVTIGVAVAN